MDPNVSRSVARITSIDIGRPARALALLRWSDVILVLGCGSGAVAIVPEALLALARSEWIDVILQLPIAAILAFAAYTGWRHAGVIDPRVWCSYLWVFPLLAGLAVFIVLSVIAEWRSHGANPFKDPESFASVYGLLVYIGISIPGFLCVLLLRHTRIAPMSAPLQDVLIELSARGGTSGLSVARHRVNVRRGVAFGVVGALLLIGVLFAPWPTRLEHLKIAARVIDQVKLLAASLLLLARRYFQVSADALLQVDRRPPILFLRSFSDDERYQYVSSTRALLDPSLESRLANHFHRFGPFVAIGSPKETVPQIGAARVLLRENEWQGRVLGWMKDASVIIMYGGTTQWVNWELRQVIESGRATRLILMFPEIKGWRPSRRAKDISLRVAQIREAFKDTPWKEELAEFDDFAGLRAMLFRPDGSMVMIRSGSRTREAYHLAALIAHQQLLKLDVSPSAGAREHTSWLRRPAVAVGVLASAAIAVLGAVYLFTRPGDTRLTFKKGELRYGGGVTDEEARSVGEHLVQQGFFSDDRDSTVQLHRKGGRYRLRFVIQSNYAADPSTAIQFAVLGTRIARESLRGKPVEVGLSDDRLNLIKVVAPTTVMAFGNCEVYYTEPVTAADAKAVGDVLLQSGFFGDDAERAVYLGREDGLYQLRFVVDPSRLDDPDVKMGFREIARGIAVEALGGRPIVLHLCDDHLRTLHRERL